MQSFEYIPLSSWLGNADTLYLDARVLWLQGDGLGSGLILMWLAIEQLIKTVVFQDRIQNRELKAKDAEAVFAEFDSWGKKINHSFASNLNALYTHHSDLFSEDEKKVLQNVYEHFEARYVDNKSRGIEIKALNVLDEIYFRLRDLISEDLPMSHIDMIDVHRKSEMYRLSDYTRFAFTDNPHFHARAHYRT